MPTTQVVLDIYILYVCMQGKEDDVVVVSELHTDTPKLF